MEKNPVNATNLKAKFTFKTTMPRDACRIHNEFSATFCVSRHGLAVKRSRCVWRIPGSIRGISD